MAVWNSVLLKIVVLSPHIYEATCLFHMYLLKTVLNSYTHYSYYTINY